MNNFLIEISNAVKTGTAAAKTAHIVLGNESADLDSVVSAIVLAFFLQKQNMTDEEAIFIPVVDCNREDLPLRTEVVHWLRRHSINLTALIHREDLQRIWKQFAAPPSVTLVDHHNPDRSLSFLEPHVVRIVDHHAVTGGGPWLQRCRDAGQFRVEPVGSCASLVAEKVLENVGEKTEGWTEIYSLLYGVILLDTLNLNPTFKKFLPLDVEILAQLESRLGIDSSERVKIYRETEDAKFDVRDLSTNDLLRRDVKFVQLPHATAAICSVAGLDYETFHRRPNLNVELDKFCTKENMKLCIILTLGSDPNHPDSEIRRGLLLFHQPESQALGTEVMEFLVKDTNLELRLVFTYDEPRLPRLLVFAQENSKLSRKYILPKVNTLLGHWSDQVTMEAMEGESDEPGLPTPLNSPSDAGEEAVDRRLPSFNNKAMVERVKEKREKHQANENAMVGVPRHVQHSASPASPLASPECFTPENSRLVSPDEDHNRLHHLPSLNNKATVDLVARKRLAGFHQPLCEESHDIAIENMNPEDDEIEEDEEERRVPFTPRNSLADEALFPIRPSSAPRGACYVIPELDSRHIDMVAEKRKRSLMEGDEEEL